MSSKLDLSDLDFPFLRSEIVGCDATFTTPFGERLLVYCDYTASGRSLRFVERYLMRIQRSYANTHTEDDITGRSMTRLLHEAEAAIKECVNAGPDGRLVAAGTGSTGAIWKFQQILGVALPPATRRLLHETLVELMGPARTRSYEALLRERQPVVFVGPYEHHSNEVSWREGLATVVEVGLDPDGCVDLADLERLLEEHAPSGRMLIGSFSATSNVTGMMTPVHDVARILHRHGALACFDYAASAPYVKIDMTPGPDANPDGASSLTGGDPSLDAIFVSPHKFLGGPGSSGILIFNRKWYHDELPPTVGGGGTVSYVSSFGHDYVGDIEERERAGTPGVLQNMKASLAFQVKAALGEDAIQAREHELVERAFRRWRDNSAIEILGNPEPGRRVGIVSFNVRAGAPESDEGAYLHPKFVTALLNDLFGIQSRAGCSCAGPYGHLLLGIGEEVSARYRQAVLRGFEGIKPGWCRVGFHYTMDDAEADYVMDAVDFVARRGACFLALYRFDVETGHWGHRDATEDEGPHFSLAAALEDYEPMEALAPGERSALYRRYLDEGERLADELSAKSPQRARFEGELGELQYFLCPAGSALDGERPTPR